MFRKYLARQPGFPPDNKQEVESIITFYTQKSSTIMSIPEKIQEPRNVDLAAAGRGVWLVKVYMLSNKNNLFDIGRYPLILWLLPYMIVRVRRVMVRDKS